MHDQPYDGDCADYKSANDERDPRGTNGPEVCLITNQPAKESHTKESGSNPFAIQNLRSYFL